MYLSINNLANQFGANLEVDQPNFGLDKGELVCLLGPSGCGKTIILNMIGSFLKPTGGQIKLDGQKLTRLSPDQRDVSTVFQSHGLFGHMKVAQNVAYGLKFRGVEGEEARQRVKTMLNYVGLTGYEDRAISVLPGGQRQRVVLARSLVVSPKLLLLDELLSNLDQKLRVKEDSP